MKLVTYDTSKQSSRFGVVDGDFIVDLANVATTLGKDSRSVSSALAFLQGGDKARAFAAELLTDTAARQPALRTAISEAIFRPAITNPPKILCLAGNYAEHIREGGAEVSPKTNLVPQVFVKPTTTLIGHRAAIRPPGQICEAVDYEGELVAIMGRGGYRISASDALSYVGGYSVFNDVSGRKLNITVERNNNPRNAFFDWLNGKWFDTFGPLGPYLVTPDEVGDPQTLALQTRVNGVVRQKTSTADMIFSIAETIEWISQFVTLEAGDVIATGTPSGVGSTTKTFLKEGDVVEVEIERVGLLRNPVGAAL